MTEMYVVLSEQRLTSLIASEVETQKRLKKELKESRFCESQLREELQRVISGDYLENPP